MRVVTSRVRDHVENIRIRQGESIVVGHRNQQYPQFLWCAAEDGHAGWVPEEFLHMDTDREATALRDYDASQLTVVKGELLEALERVELMGKIQETYGITKDEADKEIKRFEELNKDYRPKASS